MAEPVSMNHPSGSHGSQVSGEEDRIGGVMETLESYLKLAQDSTDAVHKMINSLKFNNEQCGYLADKLEVVVQTASSFLKVSKRELGGSFSSDQDSFRLTEVFKLLVALAKLTERFFQGSSGSAWVQAAMSLTMMSEYVASLGFNLELCRLAFSKDCAVTRCLTLVEVGDISKAEAEIVDKKAEVDLKTLLEKVTLQLNSLVGNDRDLAAFLLQRLLRVKPNSTSTEVDTLWSRLFVVQGQQLGRGASATVYNANWLGLCVAKKTFDGLDNIEFSKEVEILSRLCHPNITSMFGCAKNEWRKKCSIIMELMDKNLHDLMDERCESTSCNLPPFSILDAVDIMLQIGEGVNYLHDQRIVHRDLKSRNILVKTVKTGNIEYVLAKLADFGISKAKDRSTTYSPLTANTGTNKWMPPEVIQMSSGSGGSALSRTNGLPHHPFKCDTYSFGMVCYEILTGQEPFSDHMYPNEIKMLILNKQRPLLPRDCPAKLKDLIKRCWSHEPEERPTFVVICKELKYLKYLLMTVHHDSIDSRPSEGFDDFENNEEGSSPVHCVCDSEGFQSPPQFFPLMEETAPNGPILMKLLDEGRQTIHEEWDTHPLIKYLEAHQDGKYLDDHQDANEKKAALSL